MVQTFLPFSDFRKSAEVLDGKRLSKQITEANQIIGLITSDQSENGLKPWSHHPCVLMWKDHVMLLKYYHNCMVDEAIKRKFKIREKYEIKEEELTSPWWLGMEIY